MTNVFAAIEVKCGKFSNIIINRNSIKIFIKKKKILNEITNIFLC